MAEIKISDLSVGDWIATESAQLAIEGNDIATAFVEKAKKPIQIVSVLGDEQLVFGRIEELDGFTTIYLKAEYIEPIPLTPEILEKNGFVKSSECCWSKPSIECACFRYGTKYWDIRTGGRNRAYRPTRISIDNILHTHQLQHALRLAGVEKEIEV